MLACQEVHLSEKKLAKFEHLFHIEALFAEKLLVCERLEKHFSLMLHSLITDTDHILVCLYPGRIIFTITCVCFTRNSLWFLQIHSLQLLSQLTSSSWFLTETE